MICGNETSCVDPTTRGFEGQSTSQSHEAEMQESSDIFNIGE
jgi:hypothetical protein